MKNLLIAFCMICSCVFSTNSMQPAQSNEELRELFGHIVRNGSFNDSPPSERRTNTPEEDTTVEFEEHNFQPIFDMAMPNTQNGSA